MQGLYVNNGIASNKRGKWVGSIYSWGQMQTDKIDSLIFDLPNLENNWRKDEEQQHGPLD